MKIRLFYLLVLLILGGCSQRNLTYLSDLEYQSLPNSPGIYSERIENTNDPRFQPDDLLSISVTSLNPEANTLFNKGEVMGVSNNYGPSTSGIYKEGYLVDKEGFIEFPVLGKIKVGGLTKEAVKENLTTSLELYLKSPIVTIRYLNYKITVIGEVNRPATFTLPSEKISVLEAIGMAGDMTPFGRRENVLIIREEEGYRKITRLNLNSGDVLKSPYFYLQQNDVVYVEPDKARAEQASTTRSNISIGLSVASLIVLVLTRLL